MMKIKKMMKTYQEGEVDENQQRLGASGPALGQRATSSLAPVRTESAVALQTSSTLGQSHSASATAKPGASCTPRHRRHRRRRRRRSAV